VDRKFNAASDATSGAGMFEDVLEVAVVAAVVGEFMVVGRECVCIC